MTSRRFLLKYFACFLFASAKFCVTLLYKVGSFSSLFAHDSRVRYSGSGGVSKASFNFKTGRGFLPKFRKAGEYFVDSLETELIAY